MNTAIGKLFTDAQELHYAKGEVILRAEDEPQGIYLLVEGVVKAYVINDGGEQCVGINYRHGELFPLTWLGGHINHEFYEAVSPCTTLRISSDVFLQQLHTDVAVASELYMSMVDQVKVYADRVDNLSYKYVRERLIYRLLYLAGRFGVRGDDGFMRVSYFTHRDIAYSINITPESLSREYEKLRRKNYVRQEGKTIILCDVPALLKKLGSNRLPAMPGLFSVS
jgi:CRP/FNR family cyclic AMP-dependent transcriptional regulator